MPCSFIARILFCFAHTFSYCNKQQREKKKCEANPNTVNQYGLVAQLVDIKKRIRVEMSKASPEQRIDDIY